MSKFFKETRKAQEWAAQEGAAGLPLDQFVQTMREGNAVAAGMAEIRLGKCSRVHLAVKRGAPVPFLQREEFPEFSAESYRALRTRLLRLQTTRGLRSVVVTSSIQGEGKTLTTLNLGLCCARLHATRVLIIDADLRSRGLSRMFGGVPSPGLAGVLSGEATSEQAILASDIPNLYFLPAGMPSMSPTELFSEARWKEFVGWCGESFSLILIDSPPVLPLADFELIASACEGVLVVVRALSTRREVLQKAAVALDPKKMLGFVFNGVKGGLNDGYDYGYSYSYGHEAVPKAKAG